MEKRIIIEGMNLSGKTSICEMLEKRYTDSSYATVHGYYYPEVVERFSENGRTDYGRIMSLQEEMDYIVGILEK